MGGDRTGDTESAGELPDGNDGLVSSRSRGKGSPVCRWSRSADGAPGAMKSAVVVLAILAASPVRAEDGYELWLRYHRVADAALLKQYRSAITGLVVSG